MNGTIAVRQAVLDDAAAIAEIYNQGIRARIATFETEERSRKSVAHGSPITTIGTRSLSRRGTKTGSSVSSAGPPHHRTARARAMPVWPSSPSTSTRTSAARASG